MNATFYRLQSEAAVLRWRRSVPESFRFAVKAHRAVTHRKKLDPSADAGDLLARFLASLAPLGERLGCMLLQFPPFVERDDGALGSLLGALPAGLPFACEFHHPSWEEPSVWESVAGKGGTICLLETQGAVPDGLPPGPIAYVRMKGARYDEPARTAWLDLLRREAEGRDVYAFAKHEGVPAGDPLTGVGLAEWLAARSSSELP